jgi:hypothetical protein
MEASKLKDALGLLVRHHAANVYRRHGGKLQAL